MLVLLCNVGSTSLKFKLYQMPREHLIMESKIERIGEQNNSLIRYSHKDKNKEYHEENRTVANFDAGIRLFLELLLDQEIGAVATIEEIDAVGFKAPHAKQITGTQIVDERVLAAMEDYSVVNPLHNPPYIDAMRLFQRILPGTPLVAVFETAFHATFPEKAQTYGIPAQWREKYGFRRYGFHGASHGFIASQVTEFSGRGTYRMISCHLGGSSSICAVKDGRSIDNSFGFSSQSGIDHANRSGDLDVFIPLYLMIREGYTAEQIKDELITNAGLKGIAGNSNDMRDILIAAGRGDDQAKLAIDVYCYEIIKYIGAYYAVLGGLDYLVFTGGIGENSATIRERICDALSHMGITLDKTRNDTCISNGIQTISRDISDVKILVIPTNEEIGIAREAYNMIHGNDK